MYIGKIHNSIVVKMYVKMKLRNEIATTTFITEITKHLLQ